MNGIIFKHGLNSSIIYHNLVDHLRQEKERDAITLEEHYYLTGELQRIYCESVRPMDIYWRMYRKTVRDPVAKKYYKLFSALSFWAHAEQENTR